MSDAPAEAATHAKMQASRVDVFYGDTRAIRDVSLDINEREVLALMGPSG
ncbi:hypothetical protein [Halochromatium sp.]